MRKQQAEHLPYIFLVVGVAGMTGEVAGQGIPEDLTHLVLMAKQTKRLGGLRQVEDLVVDRLATNPVVFDFSETLDQYAAAIREASWFVLSARKTDRLLRDLLFDRAFALRVRGFARNYRGAELDMHFSLADDLSRLADFFVVLRDHGMPGLVTRLERGTI